MRLEQDKQSTRNKMLNQERDNDVFIFNLKKNYFLFSSILAQGI